MNELVSIIVPSFNSEQFIEATITSIFLQSYKNWELIVVDDCSTDTTQNIVKNLSLQDSRIRLLILEKNSGGPAIPRNRGLREAKGNYIAFLDADDIWHPDKISTQVGKIKATSADLICSFVRNFKDDAKIKNENFDYNTLIVNEVKFLKMRNSIPTSSVLARKEVFSDFEFNDKHNTVEDFHLWLRLSGAGYRILKIYQVLAYYRISTNQISGSKLDLWRKLFVMHLENSRNNYIASAFFVLTHIIGAFYMRFLRKLM